MQLGFDIDWTGIATNLSKGVLAYQQGRDAVKLQMAQLQAQTAAQQRAMQPPSPYPTAGVATGMYPAPMVGGGSPLYYQPKPAGLPTPVIVGGVAALAVLGIALFPRRR